MIRGGALVLVLLAGCPNSRIPPHLRLPTTTSDTATQGTIEDLDGLLLALIGKDPLGRAPGSVQVEQARSVDGGEPYAELLEAAERLGPRNDEALRKLRSLESAHRGTPVVAFSRGVRLREIEATIGASSSLDSATETRILQLLTPLTTTERDDALPRPPLRWLGGDDTLQEAVLVVGDRWALSGWLDGPGTDLQPVADALATAPFDALRGTPTARLVLARAAGSDEDPSGGLRDLDRASKGLLLEMVQDSKAGRERSAAFWQEVGTELSSDRPRDALLARAEERLTDASAKDRAAGGALLALHARRIWGRCPAAPCTGLDRVDSMGAAARWDDDVARYARRLQIAALHQAIDGIDVSRSTVRYPTAAVDLTDALIGTGAAPPDALVVRQRTPDASTWLTLGRSVGVEQCTTWEEARAALRAWAAGRAAEALKQERDADARDALREVVRAGS